MLHVARERVHRGRRHEAAGRGKGIRRPSARCAPGHEYRQAEVGRVEVQRRVFDQRAPVVEDAVAAAQRSGGAPESIVQAAPTRGAKFTASVVTPARGTPFSPHRQQGRRRRVEYNHSVINVDRRRVQLVAQAGVDGEPAGHPPVVLREQVDRGGSQRLRVVVVREDRDRRQAQQQIGNAIARIGALKVELTAREHVIEAVRPIVPELAARLDQVLPAFDADGVREVHACSSAERTGSETSSPTPSIPSDLDGREPQIGRPTAPAPSCPARRTRRRPDCLA